ncbi:MAG: DUF6503 family protein [Bacteroidota bacterium]
MRFFYFTLSLFMLMVVACEEPPPFPDAQTIIDRTIANAGGAQYENAEIEFSFRGRTYRSKRKEGIYQLERITTDSKDIVRDVLSNTGFQRYKNGQLVSVPDSMALRYSNSVNSVHYFAQLPYGLNAPAAQKEFLGVDTIRGELYFEIGISFLETGGGTDFQDEFVYWIHQDNYTIDYLAYNYETDGGGIRFREAYNSRMVNGIRFVG